MRVQILDFVDGARAARGLAVIIDVFRAFSLEPYAAAAGARLLPVAEPEHALELKRRHPDWLVAGERNARRLPGFDYGNSPHEITSRPLKGITVVHTTHAGTQGLVNAHGADAVLTGSLVNAAAIVRYARRLAPAVVSIVRMGHKAQVRCIEDDVCAQILSARLLDEPVDEAALIALLPESPAAQKFLDPQATYAPIEDLALCMALDRFDFVLRLMPPDAEGLRFVERIDV